MFVDDDLLNAHVLILEGFPDRIDPSRGGDLHLETGKAFSHKIDEIRQANRDRIRSGPINPFQKLDELSISFLGILKVPKAGGIEQVTEFEPSFMAGFDISLDMVSVDLRKDKSRPCASYYIEGELSEEGIDGCPF
jgi:hypothetical protein